MKTPKTLLTALAVTGVFAMCAGVWAQDQNTPTTTTVVTTTVVPESDHLSVSDRIFLMDVAHANAREIELSRVAYHQANSPAISEFAKHMLRTHRKLQDQVVTAYGNRLFMKDWPSAVSTSNYPVMNDWIGGSPEEEKPGYNNWNYLFADDWSAVHELRNMNGETLDNTYIQEMAQDHAMLLDKINKEDQTTDNADIKAMISQCRPIVEHHLYMARYWRTDTAAMGKFFYEN